MADSPPVRKLNNYLAVSVREYDDGTNSALYLKMEPTTTRIIPRQLPSVEQPAKDPFAPAELLLMACLEMYARELDAHLELPW